MTAAARLDTGVELLAAWRVQPGALMVLGRTGAALPASGSVHVARVPGGRGAFRALSWPAPGEGRVFLAAIRLPDRVDPQEGAALLLRGAGGEAVPLVLRETSPDAGFGQQVARLAGVHAAAAARFMLETLRPPGDRPGRQEVATVGTMLRAFLSLAAQPDGCIEIMAEAPGACVLLQGWGAAMTGAVQVVLAGRTLPCFDGHAGDFPRADIASPAVGVMLVLPPGAAAALPGIDHVFVLSDRGLHGRTLVEHRLLDPASSLGHIRHMLPALRCPAAMQALLLDALRPRFDGRDTLSGNAHKVRAAIDCALSVPGVGAYVSGWAFDPLRQLAALHVCGAQGFEARLDGGWTRIPRQDVAEAFRDQPGFPPGPGIDSGFAVFAPGAPGAGEALHLRFTFTDGDRAFLPIAAADPGDPAVRARLLAGIDLFKPSGLPIVERHVGPLLARVRPAVAAPARVALLGPLDREHAVVVPLAAPVPPRGLLSSFLHDPAAATEQIVLVCGPEWSVPALDALRDHVRFYGLPASILACDETAGPMMALHAAAAETGARTLLVAGPGVCGRAPGWRQALRLAASGAAFACPTLVYEDWSIRWAGASALRFHEGAPFAQAQAAHAGMPAQARPAQARAAQAPPVATATGSLACCLVQRAALAALDGPGAYSTDAGREAAFFLRLRAAGMGGVWAQSVQAYAPEEHEAASGPAAALVDGWILRDTWLEA